MAKLDTVKPHEEWDGVYFTRGLGILGGKEEVALAVVKRGRVYSGGPYWTAATT